MEILIREKCEECDGQGVVSSPEWVEFFQVDEEHKKKNGKHMSNDEFDKYWMERGYDLRRLPPEEPSCPSCEGAKITQRFISIQELAGLIKNFI